MQLSYRTYSSYHWSSISLSQHNQTEQRKIHNAINEVSKGDCIIMGDFNHGNIKCRSPRHKHWPAGPAHFSDRRTSSGQYILSVTGPYGPPRYMPGHQISNSAGPNDDNSQCVFFARSPVPHLGGFRAALLLQRDASVSRVRVWHVNQTH